MFARRAGPDEDCGRLSKLAGRQELTLTVCVCVGKGGWTPGEKAS